MKVHHEVSSHGLYLCARVVCHCVFLSSVCGVHLYSKYVWTKYLCVSGTLCLYVCPGTMVVSTLTDLDLCGIPLYQLWCIHGASSHVISAILVCTFDLYMHYVWQYIPYAWMGCATTKCVVHVSVIYATIWVLEGWSWGLLLDNLGAWIETKFYTYHSLLISRYCLELLPMAMQYN